MTEPKIQLTQQEAFDRVCDHLRQQRTRSVDAHGCCVYRSPNGHRCAVGALIPDGLYDPRMERRGVPNLNWKFGLFPPELEPLLEDLQFAHDSASFARPRFRRALRSVGLRYGLDITKTERTHR